ncbi:hypothetical protein CVD28_07505 [Bacillus sp. M6-12]|uniref:hypothetical protein n=1 Tax=Bacillus sp. M6-12 TaxID=2054166 RepID=UPI000C78FF1D|nr:hypothetical protein [Bacillus sp. M6-12]PLS18135.1 hypothetical protein CVD28_07505 [Bacillus sp. M6-12]
MRIKQPLYFVMFIAFIIAFVSSPFWLWLLKPEKELNVLIFDKTVPDDSFREHKGLTWILNNEKYKKDNQTYSIRDYIGFNHDGKKNYQTSRLQKKLEDSDLIYLADQYGVSKEEPYSTNKSQEETFHGGLEEKDVEAIEKSLRSNGGTLIAEFNTFASPTGEKPKEQMSNLLNVDWTGWTGRFFTDFSSSEVPGWVRNNYLMQYGKKWELEGRGLVLSNEQGGLIVFQEKELSGNGPEFKLTKEGRDTLDRNIKTTYSYWFDIIEPRNKSEIFAEYSLPLTKAGKDKLAAYGLSETFPAIIHHQNASYNSFYFAGDFADEKEVPEIYQTSGLSAWKRTVGAKDSFFWTGYVPLMNGILDKGLNRTVKPAKIEVAEQSGVNFNSKTGENYIQVKKNGSWEDLLIKGVNMGIAKPGFFPGETSITREEYLRWFGYIGAMNANAIRVYTLHPPEFYQALYEYNQQAKEPLYLFHGIWAEEEMMLEKQNMYTKEVSASFKENLRHIIDSVHGNANIPERTGNASGEYRYDVSKYVLGYVLGIEWDPGVVDETNKRNKSVSQHNGTYFYTENASPFEIWLSQMMEYAAVYEEKKYNWQHSMSFTNWVTTDMLTHPAEPSQTEDMAVVNPNHVKKKNSYHAGLFASYHIYPYYPDFLNYEEKYLNYKDKSGKKNSYAGYLHDLRKEHSMPVIVAEFGVPASRGLTHVNPQGLNQGKHSEKAQGKIDSYLYQSILDEKYGGGLLFSWQDEWFKRTWNTMDFDNPDRRPFWSNIQTNEQRFGLLAFDSKDSILLDGETADWQLKRSKPLYSSAEKKSFLKSMYAESDYEGLYMRIELNRAFNKDEDQIQLVFDTIPGQGQNMLSVKDGINVNGLEGTDFLAEISNEDNSRIMVDSYYDSFYFQYANLLKMIPHEEYASRKNNGIFHPIRLALNKELTIPSKKQTVPFQSFETGKLMWGNGNPGSQHYDSLTDISIAENKKTLEIRIPWQLLNVKDPSLKEVIGDLWKKGLTHGETINGIKIGAIGYEGKNGSLSSFPESSGNSLPMKKAAVFTWNEWNEPSYQERLKPSYYIMKDTYKKLRLKGNKHEENTAGGR